MTFKGIQKYSELKEMQFLPLGVVLKSGKQEASILDKFYCIYKTGMPLGHCPNKRKNIIDAIVSANGISDFDSPAKSQKINRSYKTSSSKF